MSAEKIKTVPTYTATIYVGMKDRDSGIVFSLDAPRAYLQAYVACGLCVSFTPTEFIYTTGGEPGFIVGLINYPRFPSSMAAIREHALAIAKGLRVLCRQYKVTVVFQDQTVMVGAE